jgi:hypothetical protein
LSGALNANVSVKAGGSTSSEITFKGTVKATFAFKLFEVSFENGKWVPRGVGASDELSFDLADEDGSGGSVVLAPGGMVRLKG